MKKLSWVILLGLIGLAFFALWVHRQLEEMDRRMKKLNAAAYEYHPTYSGTVTSIYEVAPVSMSGLEGGVTTTTIKSIKSVASGTVVCYTTDGEIPGASQGCRP